MNVKYIHWLENKEKLINYLTLIINYHDKIYII